MGKHWFLLLPLLTAAWAPHAGAQDVWAYEVIRPDNTSQIYFRAPFDLTYPPADMPAPSLANTPIDGNVAVRMTPQEEAQRLKAPKLRIITVPASTATNLRSMPLP